MKEHDVISYPNNFLSQVIIRIDFIEYIETRKLFNNDLIKIIRKHYTRQSLPIQTNYDSVNINMPKDSSKEPTINRNLKSGIAMDFIDTSMKNKITLTNKAMILEFNKYESFNNTIEIIASLLLQLTNLSEFGSSRIGLRYINLFEQNRIKISKTMFNQPIVNALYYKDNKTISEKYTLTRSMCLDEYVHNNAILNVRYGFYNPDYPGTLNKNDFAIDFDYFTQEPMQEEEEILSFIKEGHAVIQESFENIITDKLRAKLNNE